MTQRRMCGAVLAALLLGLARVPAPAAGPPSAGGGSADFRDRFGGVGVQVAKPTGSFRVQKLGNRWVFVTPEGTAFWMLGVFAVDFGTQTYMDTIRRKYARPTDPPRLMAYNAQLVWGTQSCRRIKSWGFNALAEYIATYASPVRDLDYPGTPPMPEDARPPYVLLIRPSAYSLRNLNNLAPGPVKSLTWGIDPALHPDVAYWRGRTTPDVFDPNFEAWVKGAVGGGGPTPPNRALRLGISTDDVDDIFGWGPGPEIPTGRTHPHVGYFALVTAPAQTKGEPLGVTYTDTRVHTKFALGDFLRERYGSVDALNAAWRAGYTTFDSDGGWPRGRGLLDESGRSPWVGRDHSTLQAMTPAAQKDLDDFLYLYARKYFLSVTRPIRQGKPRGTPGYPLIMGPATLNGWSGLTRRPILKAAGEFLDVVQANLTRRNLEATVASVGDLPITTWEGQPANPDSALYAYANPGWGVMTQAERGRAYTENILARFNLRTAAGVHPVVGIKWWAWLDSWGEKTNWGLVSFLDNAYDAKEAVAARGTDPWGFPTGGEERNYGDFISAVRQANFALMLRLREGLLGGTRPVPKWSARSTGGWKR